MVEVDVFIQSGEGATRTQRLRVEGAVSIGRNQQNTLCLEGDGISRTHVLIDVSSRGLRVEDRSSNGTLAGDILLRRRSAEVPYGTPIVVGHYTLVVNPAGVPLAHPSQESYAQSGTGPAYAQPSPQAFAQTGQSLAFGATTSTSGAVPGAIAYLPGANHAGSRTHQPGQLPPYAAPPQPTPKHGAPHPAAHVPKVVVADHPTEAAKKPTIPAPAPSVDSIQALEVERDLRREIHNKLLENLDLAKLDASKLDDPSMRPRVLTALRRIVKQLETRIPPEWDHDQLVGELADEALGLGPLERFLADPTINEIMVVDPSTIYVEQNGKLVKAPARFTDDERVRAVIERIVTPLGRRIDESSPLVDARLKDGSRVNAIIRPLALRGSCITIRKFAKIPLTVEKLISYGAVTAQMARFLQRAVVCKKNVVISGGTGSGKTTLLNVLSGAIPADERIVTIEDAAELQLKQPHVVSLETRPANMEGRGEYTIRDLVKNALRMRPDRIVVGECRGGEALDMLQAMNTGHDGSLTTTHANSPVEAVARIETLVLMAGVDLPSRAIREQISTSIHMVVQQTRFSDGTRRITDIAEVSGLEDDGSIALRSIFEFVRTGTGPGGKILGEHRATGYLPSFLDEFIIAGLVHRGEPYL